MGALTRAVDKGDVAQKLHAIALKAGDFAQGLILLAAAIRLVALRPASTK